jgi:hypothetical protein
MSLSIHEEYLMRVKNDVRNHHDISSSSRGADISNPMPSTSSRAEIPSSFVSEWKSAWDAEMHNSLPKEGLHIPNSLNFDTTPHKSIMPNSSNRSIQMHDSTPKKTEIVKSMNHNSTPRKTKISTPFG